jgi:antitoxin (DNA-binding transcriptional repressor) of toxin-antitoxin stability system
MPRTVSSTEVSRHFSDYLNRVAYKGEHFILLRGKKVLAELKPAPRGRRLGDLPSLFASLPHLPKEEAEAFLKDLKKAELTKRPLRSRWAS